MAEYIDREQLLELINENCKYKNPTNEYTRGCNEVCDWAIKTIKNIPTADVQEIRHGKWINENRMYGTISAQCSVCGLFSGVWLRNAPYKYCPYCGAKMNGKEAEAKWNKRIYEEDK